MTDLNTAIAKYKHIYKNNYKGYDFPVFVFNDAIWKIPPDYEHDARLYMALAVEMMEKYEIRLGADGNEQKYCELYEYDLEYDLPVFISSDQADDLGTAICMAYCKLKGIEVVG